VEKIGFTEMLYSVVIGISFLRISLEMSAISVLMFSFAFAVIVDDWIQYHYFIHIAQGEKEGGTKKRLLLMIIDVLFLAIWYLIIILPGNLFQYYLFLFFALFLLGAIWTLIAVGRVGGIIGFVKNTDISLAVYFFAVFAGYFLYGNAPERFIIMLASIIFWALTRISTWSEIVGSEFSL
jgi:hypothetical protein